jgi:hypothetical protein
MSQNISFNVIALKRKIDDFYPGNIFVVKDTRRGDADARTFIRELREFLPFSAPSRAKENGEQNRACAVQKQGQR